MTTVRAFFLQIRALFPNFWNRAGDTSPPPHSSYAPGKVIFHCFISGIRDYFIRKLSICFFNRDLNRGCLVYMSSLRCSLSKCLTNLRRQFLVRKIFLCTLIFRTQAFAGSTCIFCLKLLYRKCVTYVVGCSFIKTCSLTSC